MRNLGVKTALVGNFDEALEHNENARELSEKMHDLSTTGMYFAFLNAVATIRGDPSRQRLLTPDFLEFAPAHAGDTNHLAHHPGDAW